MTVPRRPRRSSAGRDQNHGGNSPDLRYRRRMDAWIPPGRSPGSAASRGGDESTWGCWSSQERGSRQRRSSGVCGVGATVHGRASWWVFLAPGSTVSSVTCSNTSTSNCGYGSDMDGGRKLTAPAIGVARASKITRGERGIEEDLMVASTAVSVGSGTAW